MMHWPVKSHLSESFTGSSLHPMYSSLQRSPWQRHIKENWLPPSWMWMFVCTGFILWSGLYVCIWSTRNHTNGSTPGNESTRCTSLNTNWNVFSQRTFHSPQVSWRRAPAKSSLWTETAASRGGPSPGRRPAAPAGRDGSPGRREPDRPAWTVRVNVHTGRRIHNSFRDLYNILLYFL